jgi:hypothetical protein
MPAPALIPRYPVLADAEASGLITAIDSFLRKRGWLVSREMRVYYTAGGSLKSYGDPGCPTMRVIRIVRRGVHLEFRVQVGPHREHEHHTEWLQRWRLRGVSLSVPSSLEAFEAWYGERWAWAEDSDRLAGVAPDVEIAE